MASSETAGTTRIKEAGAACAELAGALRAAGVVLPSLGLDTASCAGPQPLALIELGRCNVATARQLAAALRAGAARDER